MASNKQLNATITIGGAVSSSLKNAFGTVSKSLQQVGGAITDLERKQKLLTQSIQTFGRQGKDVDSLRAKYAANTAAIDKLRVAQERLKRVEDARERNLAKREAYKSGILETVALGATVAVPIKAAMDFESTMADIRKVVDFPEPDGLQKMGQTILDMSRRLPMTANDIGKIIAAGGQSGIATKELTAFAESAIKMGVAFDITADEAGQAMAEMRAAFRMTQPQVNALADKINYLGNNTAASAKDIMEIVQRIGPLGEVAGAASGSIAAMGATLRGMGVQNEIAATGIKNLLLTLSSGKAATKAQKEVFKQLGYTSSEVAKSMQLNADETIRVILKKLSKLPKHAQAAALTQLFGKEVVGSIAPLLTNLDQLQANLALVADKTKYAGSMEKEYQARAATTANSLVIFRNQVNALGITIGSVLLPAVNSVLMTVGPWVGKITELAQKHPTVTKAIVATAGALVTMKVATFALGFAFTYLRGGMLGIIGLFARTAAGAALVGTATTAASTGVGILGKAFLFLGRGIMWAGRMLLMNPIGLAVTAIAGAAYLMYENWDKLKPWFTQLWKDITDIFDAAIGKLMGMINGVMDKWNTFKSSVSEGVGDAWQKTKNFFSDPFGNDEPGSKPAAAAPGLTPPPAPPMANRGGNTYQDNSQNTTTIVQRPGESNADLAKRITAEQERQRQIRQRSMMTDGAYQP
jgi:TP901 family phage tail tape measure protein